MYYELYVDSLFLVNFVMNLYLLILVNRKVLRTATRKRIILGALVGAFFYMLPFVLPFPVWIKYPVFLVGGMGGMIAVTFHPKTIQGFCKIFSCLLGYSFLLGGGLLFIKENFPFGKYMLMQVTGVCGIGGIGALIAGYLGEQAQKKKQQSRCRVTLSNKEHQICVPALLDSGNGLYEPISGKPVSVITQSVFGALWDEKEVPFRAIPYHSIGRKNGILKGYLLPKLEVEVDGVRKQLTDVYVAVGEEEIKVPVILNPAILDCG